MLAAAGGGWACPGSFPQMMHQFGFLPTAGMLGGGSMVHTAAGGGSVAPGFEPSRQLPGDRFRAVVQQGDWVCAHCRSHNYAARDDCHNCLAEFDSLSRPAEAVEDHGVARDWICGACGNQNWPVNVVCRRCQADRPSSVTLPRAGERGGRGGGGGVGSVASRVRRRSPSPDESPELGRDAQRFLAGMRERSERQAMQYQLLRNQRPTVGQMVQPSRKRRRLEQEQQQQQLESADPPSQPQ
eukprot:Hpha_TRINITY_DN29653_c0_g1::TRINITY_DN29653_c0_g1_i1::g.165111::m.165111